jgi:hypothetical protein
MHSYPYACRTYTPSDMLYATIPGCNSDLSYGIDFSSYTKEDDEDYTYLGQYSCPAYIRYTSCNPGFFMYHRDSTEDHRYDGTPKAGNKCAVCPDGYECEGRLTKPVLLNSSAQYCGEYAGSLYQKIVRYALQTCVRPTMAQQEIPKSILGDVNTVMDTIRSTMGAELSKECDRLGGVWVDAPGGTYENKEGKQTFIGYANCKDGTKPCVMKAFYDQTGANKRWGYCTEK